MEEKTGKYINCEKSCENRRRYHVEKNACLKDHINIKDLLGKNHSKIKTAWI